MDNAFRKGLLPRLRAWFSGVLLYGIALIIYAASPYYAGFIPTAPFDTAKVYPSLRFLAGAFMFLLGPDPLAVLVRLYSGYVILGLLWFLFYKKANVDTKTYLFWKISAKLIKKAASVALGTEAPAGGISSRERSIFLYFILKFFYAPMMIVFLFGNVSTVLSNISIILAGGAPASASISAIYISLLYLLFIIDTTYFAIGYIFEFSSWKNEMRSVEPTVFGWVVAFACYPPFNGFTSALFGWGSSDFSWFGNAEATVFAAFASLVLMGIYVWATVALGLKSSNLTNRGIVDRGPYAYVRHPAYVSKNLSWALMGLPIIAINPLAAVSIFIWAGIYGLRALTEERHLSADPEYREYCERVPYRFIPGVV